MTSAGPGLICERRWNGWTIRRMHGQYDAALTEFVADIYYGSPHFSFPISRQELLAAMTEEDVRFAEYSRVLTIQSTEGPILGTIRAIDGSDGTPLPIQRAFDVDLSRLVLEKAPVGRVFEVARLAVRPEVQNLIKVLLAEGLANCRSDDLMVAAIDRSVLRGLRRLAMPWKDIGRPREYLGSMTYPVALCVREIPGCLTGSGAGSRYSRREGAAMGETAD